MAQDVGRAFLYRPPELSPPPSISEPSGWSFPERGRPRETPERPQQATVSRVGQGGDVETRVEEATEHLTSLERTVERVQHLLGSAAFLDEESFGVVSLQTQYSTTILAQEKRIQKLLGELAAAKQTEQALRAQIDDKDGDLRLAEATIRELKREKADQEVVAKAHAEELVRKNEQVEELELRLATLLGGAGGSSSGGGGGAPF